MLLLGNQLGRPKNFISSFYANFSSLCINQHFQGKTIFKNSEKSLKIQIHRQLTWFTFKQFSRFFQNFFQIFKKQKQQKCKIPPLDGSADRPFKRHAKRAISVTFVEMPNFNSFNMKMCGGKPPAPLSAHAPIKANQLIDLAFIQMRPTMTHASLECKRFKKKKI